MSKLAKVRSRSRDRRIARKKERRICLTKYCRHEARAGRCYCNTCRARKYENPLRRLFRNLKASAKRRKKDFRISFEYFREVAVRAGYDLFKGRGSTDLQIDRRRNHLGYVPGNIQVLNSREHHRKSWAERTGWSWSKRGGAHADYPDDEIHPF